MHRPTEEVQVWIPAVEEHGEPGLLRQVQLLLKVPAGEETAGGANTERYEAWMGQNIEPKNQTCQSEDKVSYMKHLKLVI